MNTKNNLIINKHNIKQANVATTRDILQEYRDMKRVESDIRHKDWLSNYQQEQERIKNIKEEIIYRD